jgi:predicted SAM-dependent methyltransferase
LVYVRKRKREFIAISYYKEEFIKIAKKANYSGVATPVNADHMAESIEQSISLVSKLLSYVPKNPVTLAGGSVFLEIGCAWGATMMAARKLGCQTIGFEIGSDNVTFARRNGLVVYDQPFLKTKIQNASVDCVYMNHVLEHLYQPVNTLKYVNRILKPGGVCYINVPNFDCYWHEIAGRSWPWLNEEAHLYHYTAHTLPAMLRKMNFQIVEMYTPASKDLNTQQIKEYQIKYPQKSPSEILKDVDGFVEQNRGESLTVIACKKER